jgi:hypothetical protein
MTAVEILFRYAAPPTERVTLALAATCEVYGMRRLQFDRVARTLRVEYDATRLNAATVARLVSQAGLEIAVPLPLAEPQLLPGPAPAA